MSERRYTLELTAQEVAQWEACGLDAHVLVARKIGELAAQAKADREADELRLPWSAGRNDETWFVQIPGHRAFFGRERAAKLASAAPELLEAVQAVKEYDASTSVYGEGGYWQKRMMPLIERALRKVETGIPEAP